MNAEPKPEPVCTVYPHLRPLGANLEGQHHHHPERTDPWPCEGRLRDPRNRTVVTLRALNPAKGDVLVLCPACPHPVPARQGHIRRHPETVAVTVKRGSDKTTIMRIDRHPDSRCVATAAIVPYLRSRSHRASNGTKT